MWDIGAKRSRVKPLKFQTEALPRVQGPHVAPAMAAGVSKTLWEIEDIVKLVEAAEAKPAKRGPYTKRGAHAI